MTTPTALTVVMPALNEAANLAGAVDNVLASFCRLRIPGELVIVNDGSSDETGILADDYAAANANIRVLHHLNPKGIGASFWAGVSVAEGEIVTMIPGDGENDAAEILRYLPLMEEVDIVVPFVFNRSMRSFSRRLLSIIYREIIKAAFGLSLNYMNGTVMYRRSIFEGIQLKSNGFFYQSELLIKAISRGYLYAEVPCALRQRGSGDSRATTWKSFREVARDFMNTFFAVRCELKGGRCENRNSQEDTGAERVDRLILDGQKLKWHQERVNAWLAGERIAPVTMDCSLSHLCTYNCSYCYGRLQKNDARLLTRDVIFRFLDDAAEIGVKAVSFVGDGESTCSPHLYDAIMRGRNNGLDMALGTNGFLLDDWRLEEILPALTYLRFNISAAQPERYAQIHGSCEDAFHKVCGTIRRAVAIKQQHALDVTIGLQMVLLPSFRDQLIPLARLGKGLGVDYLVVKHCSDDEFGTLGVDYEAYQGLVDDLKMVELFSDESYQVSVKWSKLLTGGKRSYSHCLGPPFIMQLSGSGLVAPCGMLFNSRYSKYHIGNIADTSFKELCQGERYWEVMGLIASERFNTHTMCGTLCLQHKVNEFLWELKHGSTHLSSETGRAPKHVNFI